MNTSNDNDAVHQPAGSISRRDFLVRVGAGGALVATAGIPPGHSLAADDTGASPTQSSFWYDAPAIDWTSAIPIGNGRIGGMIFGEVQDEQVLLNESGIWCGPPCPADNPRGPEIIARVRELLFAGRPVEAEAICEKELLDPDPDEDRCYQPLGFLRVRHESEGDVTGYRRTLDYGSALVTTRFERGGVAHRREAFVSAPDQVLVLRYTAGQPGNMSLSVGLDRPDGATVTAEGDRRLRISGQAFAKGKRYPGTRFDALVQVVAEGARSWPRTIA